MNYIRFRNPMIQHVFTAKYVTNNLPYITSLMIFIHDYSPMMQKY